MVPLDQLKDLARECAEIAHDGQMYGEHPYMYHLDAVAELLAPCGKMAVAVGYLHDVVEDTDIDLTYIRHRFGHEIAFLVFLVTDEPGRNRRERKKRTNEKLAKVGELHWLALVVKAADRLANVRQAKAEGNESNLAMYRKEYYEFRNAARRPGLCESWWDEMDRILIVEGASDG